MFVVNLHLLAVRFAPPPGCPTQVGRAGSMVGGAGRRVGGVVGGVVGLVWGGRAAAAPAEGYDGDGTDVAMDAER